MSQRVGLMTNFEVARELADRTLNFFGSVYATGEDVDDLARAIIAHNVRWANDRFDLNIPDSNQED